MSERSMMFQLGESITSETAEFALLKEGRDLMYNSSTTLDHVRDDAGAKNIHMNTTVTGNDKYLNQAQGTLHVTGIRTREDEAEIDESLTNDTGKTVFTSLIHVHDLPDQDATPGMKTSNYNIQYHGAADVSRATDWTCVKEEGEGDKPYTCDGTVTDGTGTLLGKVHSVTVEQQGTDDSNERSVSTVSDPQGKYLGTVTKTVERPSDGASIKVTVNVTHDEVPKN